MLEEREDPKRAEKPPEKGPPEGESPESVAGGGSLLRVAGAVKSYRALRALGGVDLDLGTGEWVGLVGPNGAGKTTLFRGLVGLLRFDAGTIEVAGQRLTRATAPRLRQHIGLVPQEIALYPALTARENLALFGQLHGCRPGELGVRIAWALEWTGLASRADHAAGEFSIGMQRRLNIACGILHRPQLLLLDEPTVGVDPQGRQRIWAMLEEVRDQGATILQSSHQLDEIQRACDRMVILDHGRVVAAGSMDDLVATTAIGARRLRAVLDRPPGEAGLDLGDLAAAGLKLEGREVVGIVEEVESQLPSLFEAIRRQGLTIEHLEVGAPRLEEIFIRLTGTELRE